MLKNLSITKRLTLGFTLLVGLLVVLAGLSLFNMHQIQSNLDQIVSVHNVEKDLAWKIRTTMDIRSNAARDSVLEHGEGRETSLGRLKALRKEMLGYQADLEKHFKERGAKPELIAQMGKIAEVDTRTKAVADVMVAAAKADDQAGAEAALANLRTHLDLVRDEINVVLKQKEAETAEAVKVSKSAYQKTMLEVAVLTGLAILVALIGAWQVTNSITGPVKEVVHAVERIAQGDLTVKLAREGGEELVRLNEGVAGMTEALRNTISKIRTGADGLSKTSDELTAAVMTVTRSTEHQSESSTSMAASLEQMTTSINHVAELADDARTMATQASEQASEGSSHIGVLMEDIAKVARTVEEGAEHARELGRESENISNIVNVIKDVADQTNLLALNAAIEAARAGELGRGFAVVADEVRKLAERSADSASEITQMVHTIQERSHAMSTRMETSVTQVRDSLVQAEQAGTTIRSIDERSRGVTGVIDEVAVALKQQAAASNDLASRVERIVQMTEANTLAMGGVTGSTSHLNDLAHGLVNSVEAFRTA